MLNLRTFSSVRIFFSQLDAFRLAVRQHAKFRWSTKVLQTAGTTSDANRARYASARCQCEMPKQECWSEMSENSGFEYAVSTETSKNLIPNRTLWRDSYADATIDLAHDSRSILPSTLTLSNFRSPHTLDSNEPSREEEERDRHAMNYLLDSHEPSREEEERDRMRFWAGYS